jgi:UDP-2,3-diacylglucosamine pyrophosphatase LpxH
MSVSSSPAPTATTGEFNTLVISDLHLGEDLTATPNEANTLHINIVERELIGFLRYYARRREDGRPWRLIINGDMVDFLSVVLLPSHPDFEGYKANVEEHEFGLRRTPLVAISKMNAVVKRHIGVFKAMARFLSRGNRIEIISGNHDTEFHWKGTQDAFTAGVAEAWGDMHEATRPGALPAEDVIAAISFHPWFFHEPGVLWVEHGHQYDECCSLRHQLYPRCPSTDEIVTNVDTAGVRYVTSYIAEAESQNMDLWSFMGYLRFGFGLGMRGCAKLAYGYYSFAKVLMQVWRADSKRGAAGQEVHDVHNERLVAMAEKWSMPAEQLRKLDSLGRMPVVSQFSKLSSVLMLDKLVFYGLGIFLAVFSLLFFSGALALAGVVAGGLIGAGLSIWSSRGREVDATATMELNSERILKLVDAKFVTFGHTHEPVARPLDNGAWYYNTGTWVPTGKPGLLRAFTHLVVHHRESGPEAQLCQWRDGASRSFTPGWKPGTVENESQVRVAQPALTASLDY